MPKLMRSPPLNRSQSMSDMDEACAGSSTGLVLEDINVTQRDSKRRRLSDTPKEYEQEDFRTIIREELRNMLHSLQSQQNTRLDALEQRITEIKTQDTEMSKINPTLIEIKKTTSSIESTVSRTKNICILTLEQRIEDIQREERKTNVEIKNVPKLAEETSETLLGLVTSLAKTVGCKVDEGHIKDIYRIKGKKVSIYLNANTPIVVEISSTILKTNLMNMCKAFNRKSKQKLCAKHLGLRSNEDTPIYVSEQLTTKGARLYFLARELAKSKTFKYCWTAYGRVYLRKHDASPIITVRSEAQINSLLQKA
ncbi:hypothetical protein ABMA27_009847 [Loxostege sticticalis]|uniref:FP protein C-terminal domain-containing protein n=1 Tax=Loxostege sticticalis TaxID=481309 RepID=A0ABR3H6N5_LOXSC